PTAVGKYDAGALDGERSKLLQAVRAIQTDSGIIIPKGMEVDLLEAGRSGTGDYQALQDAMNATIAKVVLGQTASTSGTPGKLGNDKLQGDVRADIIKADADLVCESWNLGPARWLTERNFPGAAVPRVFRVTDEPEDLTERADRDGKVKALGYKPKLDYITTTYGEGWEPTNDVSPTDPHAPPSAAARPGAQFAEPVVAPPAPESALADQLDQVAQPMVLGWVDQLAGMADAAGSLEELREMILAAYDDLPTDQLAAALSASTLAAQAAGRYDVTEQSDG
ncbi:MAG: phage portal protein family protein, partial [Rhodanobacter sp.]